MKSNAPRYILLGLFSVIIIVIDQVTKVYIMQTMRLHESIVVIPNLFSITYIRNPGAAFGILSTSSGSFRFIFFGLTSLFALGLLGTILIRTLGEIAGTSVSPTIIADLSPVELRGVYQGIFGAAWGLSYFLGPLAGGWVYEHWGSNTLWVSCLILGFVIALCYLALSAPARRQMTETNSASTD